jgi:hypothetical protein
MFLILQQANLSMKASTTNQSSHGEWRFVDTGNWFGV